MNSEVPLTQVPIGAMFTEVCGCYCQVTAQNKHVTTGHDSVAFTVIRICYTCKRSGFDDGFEDGSKYANSYLVTPDPLSELLYE